MIGTIWTNNERPASPCPVCMMHFGPWRERFPQRLLSEKPMHCYGFAATTVDFWVIFGSVLSCFGLFLMVRNNRGAHSIIRTRDGGHLEHGVETTPC